eukprot:CAMPEP_0119143108 /NCGR_PEP_ID=MMETSP1310-20130426/33814_1 /TAXON_ID=464262 /ORGANISM="Genus nov. species nov., Strain RCC2339" /LENGTH=251 /DNA_ID=CAMNT_0007134707 /DNA_START=57 /DNA_END=812 /DNA_ORIENTATION=+
MSMGEGGIEEIEDGDIPVEEETGKGESGEEFSVVSESIGSRETVVGIHDGDEADCPTDDVTEEGEGLSWDEIVEKRNAAIELKNKGNHEFSQQNYQAALCYYSQAIDESDAANPDLAVFHCNKSACNLKFSQFEEAKQSCTEAIRLRPDYVKALVRRAAAYEGLGRPQEAYDDYKKVLELDPSVKVAQAGVQRLPPIIKEKEAQDLAELTGKMKSLGDMFLRPFGMSTDDFEMKQDPNSGGYSIQMKSQKP